MDPFSVFVETHIIYIKVNIQFMGLSHNKAFDGTDPFRYSTDLFQKLYMAGIRIRKRLEGFLKLHPHFTLHKF